MEATAIAHVCHNFNVPFVVVRAISDVADQQSHLSFDEFLAVAAKAVSLMVSHWCKKLLHMAKNHCSGRWSPCLYTPLCGSTPRRAIITRLHNALNLPARAGITPVGVSSYSTILHKRKRLTGFRTAGDESGTHCRALKPDLVIAGVEVMPSGRLTSSLHFRNKSDVGRCDKH